MKYRVGLVFVVFVLLWIGLIARVSFLQLAPNEKLSKFQKRQFDTVVTLEPRRGAILDRNGKRLAASITAYSLFADPQLLEAPKRVAKRLARTLKMDRKKIYEKIKNKKRRFVWLKRRLPVEVRNKIQKWKVRGLAFVEESDRVYPNEELLGPVLGFVGSDGSGLEGLESKYNDFLKGTQRKINLKRDARGRPLLVEGRVFLQKPQGSDVQLTIDREMQYELERELSNAMELHEAEAAYGVILDARNSEVLALANLPSFNPNQPFSSKPKLRRNRAIADMFEPGSTMKTFAVAASLMNGKLAPNTKYFCENGKMKIGRRGQISEANRKHSFGWLTATEILAKSSNIGVAKIAFELGGKSLRETLSSFGFGEKTGIALGAEAKGILSPLPWRDLKLATIAFGHGIAVSPLQVANAYAAIANGGILNQPYIVKSIHNQVTKERKVNSPVQVRRVMSMRAAETLKLMLLSVTAEGGTAMAARVRGFPVAGKTGTAQKVDPNNRGYLKGAYVASFAGIIPANNPRFVIYIAIDNPQKGYYGSHVAAPVFSKVAGFAVRHEKLSPTVIEEGSFLTAKGRFGFDSPDFESANAKDLKDQAKAPTERAEILRSVAKEAAKTRKKKIVPKLLGLSFREVVRKVQGTDLEIEVVGEGRVFKTIPRSGKFPRSGEKVKIYFR